MSWEDGARCGVEGVSGSRTLVLGRDAWGYGSVLEGSFRFLSLRGSSFLVRSRYDPR